ncbi:hypothetical protein ACW7GZ_07990 [Luteimonas sp. A537]
MSLNPGPPLERLTRRLIDTPREFLDPPHIGRSGQVAVAALVTDLVALHGDRVTLAGLAPFRADADADAGALSLVAVATWWLADEALVALRIPAARLLPVLADAVAELAGEATAVRYVEQPDRREEFVRVLLDRLEMRPQGETPAQAQDRLASVSSVERRRLLQASRAAEKRARAIREALARKAAEESADKWSRE